MKSTVFFRLALVVLLATVCFLTEAAQQADEAADESAPDLTARRRDPARVMGILRGDCKKCHPAEVASWMKTTHFQSADLRLYAYEGNTKKYVDALKIERSRLLTDSVCTKCHSTQATIAGESKVIGGVSCESCHGAAGGEDGWLNRHQSYHESLVIPRSQESDEHRQARIEHCESAGMIRAENLYDQARTCFGCHVVDNDALIAAGHKMSSATFEYVSWSDGEVRHNFLLDRTKNADAPTLWMKRGNGNPQNRKRVKFVVGVMAQLEMSLRARAKSKNPVVIPQIGGSIAAVNGKLTQIGAMSGSPEPLAITGIITPLLATLFAPLPTDEKTYNDAADKVSAEAQKFVKNHDGSKLVAIDALIQATLPHYSQQFKQKYLKE